MSSFFGSSFWFFVFLCSFMRCLEKVQLHRVIIVLLNISAAVKHKVFWPSNTDTKHSPQSKAGAASGWFFFPLRSLRIFHLVVHGGLDWQCALKSADFSRWCIVTSRSAELHISIWQQQAAQLFKSPTMSQAQTQKSESFLHFFSCYIRVSSQRS